MSALTKLFSLVDSNEAEVRRLRKVVEQVNALKAETAALSDDELRSRTALLREQLVAAGRERLKAFDPDRVALRTREVLGL